MRNAGEVGILPLFLYIYIGGLDSLVFQTPHCASPETVSCNKVGQTFGPSDFISADKKMKLIIFILLLTSSVFGQTVDFKVNGGKTNIYQDAIRHYIDSIHKSSKLTFDTLFVLNNEFFPESSARNTEGVINKINIVFQDTAYISNRLKYHRSFMALNISDNQNSGKEQISISIISFLVTKDQVKNIFVPLKSCRVRYFYNQTKKEFEYKNIVCDY